MRQKIQATLLIVAALLISCEKKLPRLDGVDLTLWKNDRQGCNGIRTTMLDSITGQKDELLGLSENAIMGLLGRPDVNELYRRNQKFYHYYLTPGPDCGLDPIATRLLIRFNALGLAKQVIVEKGV